MSGDNTHFDLECVDLKLSLQVAWTQVYKAGATHWMEVPRIPKPVRLPSDSGPFLYAVPARLILFNGDPKIKEANMNTYDLRKARPDIPTDRKIICPVYPLPGGLKTVEEAEPMVRSWLATAEYGNEPDHDGDNSKSWRISNGGWNRVDVPGAYSAFVQIEPCWIMYGK